MNECKEEGVSKSAMRVRKGEKMWSDKKKLRLFVSASESFVTALELRRLLLLLR